MIAIMIAIALFDQEIQKRTGFHLNAREYRKFGNTEREYRIPEIPVPEKFGNTEFPKNSHSRTSIFPKEKKIGNGPSLVCT